MSRSRPVIAVLGEHADDRPPHLQSLEDRVDLRFTDAEGLDEAVGGAQGLFLWDFFSTALEGVWPRCTDLEWIHVAAAGVDSLLFEDLRASSVTVTNARGTFDRPIAEFVLASILAHVKRLHESRQLQHERVWRHRETRSLQGSRAMIIGTGAIGRETARLLRAVGMEVRGVGRTARGEDPDFGAVVASSDLATAVGWCDHLVNAAPLTPATTGLIDAEVLAAMTTTAHLVNVGRGATVVEADLAEALVGDVIAGASLDVFEVEPLPSDSPLWDAPGCVISAHLSGDVVGWRDTLARQFVANAERWLAGEPLENVVDKELGYVPGGTR
ncbi:D-2-hydroxyacid dehydrogenase [Ornithinimicrobium cavernae]|uniref:D-2-hydroxyacid dehydrogenase n=1 Tax=Ornithinimicrobium cavernae TaxID=2666047 RepID=UPI001F18B054|nr:D-2-hydroxyacid dehydrogenase [Ornithinimicrobium cavernae]